MTAPARISTPCLRVCRIDPATKLCEGCGRTAEEIMRWGSTPEAERLRIMAGLDERLRRAYAPLAAPEGR